MNSPVSKVPKVIAIIIILSLFLIPTIIAIKYAALSEIYSHFVTTVSNLIGINQYIINALSAALFVPFILGISYVLSFNKRKRAIGSMILTFLFVSYNLSLYSFTKDSNFSFSEGSPLKWYALTPEGVKYYDRGGVDEIYGIELKPVTPEVIRNLKLIEKGLFTPINPENAAFFNPITGEAQIWYYKYDDGSFDFFDKPGYHPTTGQALNSVTKEIVDQYSKQKKSSKNIKPKSNTNNASKYKSSPSLINNNLNIKTNENNIAIVINAPNQKYSSIAESKWQNLLKPNHTRLIFNYFKPDFMNAGHFDKIYNGDYSKIEDLKIQSQVNNIILFKIDFSFRENIVAEQKLISCDVSISYQTFDRDWRKVDSNSYSAIGPGFNETEALKRGLEIIAENYPIENIKPTS